jgi:hypothetical protein
MRVLLAFFGSTFAFVLASGVIAIYGLDYFEHAWSRSGSLQIYGLLGVGLGALSALGAWLAFVASNNRPRVGEWKPFLLPALFTALIGTASLWGLGSRIGLFATALIFVAAAALTTFLSTRRLPQK